MPWECRCSRSTLPMPKGAASCGARRCCSQAITGTAIHLTGIRARRDKPGLAPQHLAAVIAVAKTRSAQVEGLALRSQELGFVPGAIQSGNFEFHIGTAGSITLPLQALVSPSRRPRCSRCNSSPALRSRPSAASPMWRPCLCTLRRACGTRPWPGWGTSAALRRSSPLLSTAARRTARARPSCFGRKRVAACSARDGWPSAACAPKCWARLQPPRCAPTGVGVRCGGRHRDVADAALSARALAGGASGPLRCHPLQRGA